jgi:hypothetical protein
LTEQNDVRETPAEREAWLDRIARDDRHDPPRLSSGVRTVLPWYYRLEAAL